MVYVLLMVDKTTGDREFMSYATREAAKSAIPQWNSWGYRILAIAESPKY